MKQKQDQNVPCFGSKLFSSVIGIHLPVLVPAVGGCSSTAPGTAASQAQLQVPKPWAIIKGRIWPIQWMGILHLSSNLFIYLGSRSASAHQSWVAPGTSAPTQGLKQGWTKPRSLLAQGLVLRWAQSSFYLFIVCKQARVHLGQDFRRQK